MPLPGLMQRIAERRHDLVERRHHHMHMRQDRKPTPAAGRARDKERTGLRDQGLTGRNAGVAGLEQLLVAEGCIDAIRFARQGGRDRLHEGVIVIGHPPPATVTREPGDILSCGLLVGHRHDRCAEFLEVFREELELFSR